MIGSLGWISAITNVIFRSSKSENDRQCNDQNKRYKRTNNDLQNTAQKSKY